MKSTIGLTVLSLFLLSFAGPVLAQETASPIVTDRPGFVFSSLTVGRGAFQYELGLPSVFLDESEGARVRSTSLGAVLRYGIGDDFELRLGAPLFTDVQTDFGPFRQTDRGYGDLEVGAKWHLLDNQGARPSFALIPSVTLPTGEAGFSAEDPVYQLSAVAEWTLASGWGVGAIAGFLNGPSAGGRYGQETLGLSVGRTLPSPAWTAYGEAAHVVTGLEGAADSSFLGAGVKYLVSNNFQLDLSFDRGLTDDSPDWLFGLGLSARF
jgi:hypothetical protein